MDAAAKLRVSYLWFVGKPVSNQLSTFRYVTVTRQARLDIELDIVSRGHADPIRVGSSHARLGSTGLTIMRTRECGS